MSVGRTHPRCSPRGGPARGVRRAAFTPAQVSTIKRIWQQSSTLGTQASAIASWTNAVDGTNTPTQGTAGQRATVDTVGGKKSMLTDGVDDGLNFPTNLTQSLLSIYAVVRPVSIAGNMCLFGSTATTIHTSLGGSWGEAGVGASTYGVISAGTTYLLEVHNYAAANIDLVQNGVVINKVGTSFPSRAATCIGHDPSGPTTQPCPARLFELFVCDVLTSATERAKVREYFRAAFTIF